MRHFETEADLDGQWRWRLRGTDGQIVATSAETFPSRDGALRAADGAQAVAAEAVVSAGPGAGIRALLRFRALINGELPPMGDQGGSAPGAGAGSGEERAEAAKGSAQTSTGVPLALSRTSMLPRVAFE